MIEDTVDGAEAVAEDVLETEEFEELEAQDEPEAEEQPESVDDEAEEEEGEAPEEEPDEEIELNFGGNKAKFKAAGTAKEVAAQAQEFADSVWSDYTRKGQEVAEKAKSLEAREGAVEKVMSLNNEALDTYSRGLALRSEIEQLSQVNLNELWQSDPDRARRVSDQLSRKQAEFQETINKVSQVEGQLTQAQQEEQSRRAAEGEAFIERQMKGFKAEKLPEVIDYAVNALGMDKATAERDWAANPSVTIAVWKAAQYDKMQAQAKKPATPKPKPAEPVKGRSGKGGKATNDVAAMSPADMAKHLGLPG